MRSRALVPMLAVLLVACSGVKGPSAPVPPEHGVRLTYGLEAPVSGEVQTELVKVLEQRLADAGVERFRVTAADGDRVQVELGASGEDAGRAVLTVPGVLGFYEVDDSYRPALGMFLQRTAGGGVERTEALQASGDLPANRLLRLDHENTPYILVAEPLLTNAHVESAERQDEPWGPAVSVQFTDAGRVSFGKATAALVDKRLAIVFDGDVMSAPVVREPITGGRAIISLGAQDNPDAVAHELVSVLRSGVLPAKVVLEAETVF